MRPLERRRVFRNTQQRDAIRQAIREADRPLSPQELVLAAQEKTPGVGVATVYRTIKKFLEQGWLTSIELPGEPPRYELSGKTHHHHFRCRSCDGVFELPGCALRFEKGLPDGFELEAHEVVLFGRCPECATSRKRRRPKRADLRP
jgi:Fur family ferric uptake transcriptional regulator